MIRRWMLICETVFWAEDRIKDEWYPKLKAANSLSEKEKVKDDYLRALAEEIVSKTL